MDIVEFIKNNFLIVLGVLFFLFKMFAGSKKPAQTPAPTFGGGSREVSSDNEQYDNGEYADDTYEEHPSLEQQRKEREKQEQDRMYQDDRRRQLNEAMRNEQQRTQQLEAMRQREYREARSNGNQQASKGILDEEDAYNGNIQKQSRQALSSDELRRAVVWSEILGQPRARRPFRK